MFRKYSEKYRGFTIRRQGDFLMIYDSCGQYLKKMDTHIIGAAKIKRDEILKIQTNIYNNIVMIAIIERRKMGRIAGIRIRNYGSLKNVKLGKLLSDTKEMELKNINAVIGQSGTGKSTLADAFGFLADCLENGVEVACDLNGRGGYGKLISQGADL